ncbi:MAG: MoxR family ATPase [Thermodesulfobacteriota bacterium]
MAGHSSVTDSELSGLSERIRRLEKNIQQVIKGKPEVIKTAIVALISRGHLLIEDVPGVGKTTLAQALANSVDLSFKRLQFTSDLLPTDILGVSIFDQNTGEFNFKHGPIFANVVFVDEINRATPKTQSALLEAMNESVVTIDGFSHRLPDPFMVVATQNPFEYKGTFPLPENQLDRFLMRIRIGYPDYESEMEILIKFNSLGFLNGIKPVLTKEELLQLQSMTQQVSIDESLLDYILSIVKETRNQKYFELGVSPRGAIALKLAAQSRALLDGRSFCIPDDIKEMVIPVLSHRVALKYEHLPEKRRQEDLLNDVLERVKVPI